MQTFLYDAVRTPRGKRKGSLAEVRPIELVVQLLHALAQRNHLDPSKVEDVILGCVTQKMEQGANIAKAAVMQAGYPNSVAGKTVNRLCASGLEAFNQAAAYIATGQMEFIIAGGVESMSRVKMGTDGGALLMDSAFHAPNYLVPQGISADLIASKFGYTRTDLDRFALRSQTNAAQAVAEGRFAKSLVAVTDLNGFSILDKDEHPRPTTTLETLASLPPAFEKLGKINGFDEVALQRHPEIEAIHHLHHAGNSSGIVDGAALTLLGSLEMGKVLGLKPRARVRSFAVVGEDPTIMLTAPAPATRKALQKAGLNKNDIDLFEVNEAFASVVLRFMEDLDVDESRINVNGGAIALGHPLGATGSILIGTLLDELERQDKTLGVATLCVGGGMGIATIIERV